MKKLFFIFFLVVLLGCAPKMVTDFRQIGATQYNNIYGAMVASTNERGPAGMSLSIIAEQKHPGWQQTVISAPQHAATAQPVAKWVPPKQSPRGKKALICPPTPAPSAKPAPAQPTVITTTTSPQLQVVGGAGGTGPSTLQSWGAALLSSAPIAGGMIGGAALLRPARTNVTQTGGGAGATAAGGVGVGYGGAGGAGGSASSSSSSSAASSASAAAAAAAD